MKLKFVEIDTLLIFNWLSPMNVTAWLHLNQFRSSWWNPETVRIREHFAEIWTKEFDRITGHFTQLESSIIQNGIKSPISIVTGPPRGIYLNNISSPITHFPPKYQNNPNQGMYTQPFGGSRLTIATKLNIQTVPCVVHDFSNLFPEAPIVTQSNYQTWFGNDYTFCSATPHIRLKRHSHIHNKKYNSMNQHTRNAQKQAALFAKEEIIKIYG